MNEPSKFVNKPNHAADFSAALPMSQTSILERSVLLSMDTCGSVAVFALGLLAGDGLTLLGQGTLGGGELSKFLLMRITALMAMEGVSMAHLGGIVVASGPGSFTGIRVGLAAAKGLADALNVPIVAVSRLGLLAAVAGTQTAVLDAHRGQVFCGFYPGVAPGKEIDGDELAAEPNNHLAAEAEPSERLMTAGEINAQEGLGGRVGVCEEAVAQFLEDLKGSPEIVRVPPPGGEELLRFGLRRFLAGQFSDVATLDGYYLRGADARLRTRPGAGQD